MKSISKVYLVILTLASVCLIFLVFFNLSTKEQKIEPTVSVDKDTDHIPLRFISSWAGHDSKAVKLKQILEQFEKDYPNIHVINESMAGEEFLFTLKTSFASSNEPDVFGLWPGSDIRALIEAGKVADLTEMLEEDKKWYEAFGKDAWEYDKVDGRIYGLPFELIYECLYINRDIFETYHVDIPRTYEDLVSAVKKLKANGVIPIAYNTSSEGTYIYQNMVMKLAGKEGVENPFDFQGNIHQEFIDGMYYMKKLYELGAFPKNYLTLQDNERDNLFINKQAAMIVQGSWFIGEQKLAPNSTSVELIPFPSFQEGKSDHTAITYGIGNGSYHMSRSAWEDPKKREAAIVFLKALTSRETADILSERSGFIPNINVLNEEVKVGSLVEQGRQIVKDSQELVAPVDHFIDRTIWQEIIVKKFPLVLEGLITPEEIFEEVKNNK